MTIPATASEISYAGDGSSVAFAIPFVFDTASDLKVTTTTAGVITEITTGFSVGGGGGSTGTLTFMVAPAIGTTLSIFDDPDITQPTDYVNNDAFPAESHERALDRVTRIVKRASQLITRAFRYPDGDPFTDGVLPSVAVRKGKLLGFNATTGQAEFVSSIPSGSMTPAGLSDFYKLTNVGGTANAITAALAGLVAYTRELALVFTPAANNTGPATINVNTIGNLNITDPAGVALLGNEMLAGMPAMLLVDDSLTMAILVNPYPASGTFVGTLTGMTAAVNPTIEWYKYGQTIQLIVTNTTPVVGTSNATNMTMTGVPAQLAPKLYNGLQASGSGSVISNGAFRFGINFFSSATAIEFQTLDVVGAQTFGNSNGFAAAGTKGLAVGTRFIYRSAA